MTQTRITRQDIETSLARLQGGVENQVADRKKTVLTVAGGTAFLIVFIFFLLGRRSGKKKTTYVEIRRV